MTVAQRKWSIYDAQESWLANIHHANHQPLGDSRPTEMKYIWRPTVLASKYTSCKSSTVRVTVAQRKWSIYDAQESWLANIHHANHQPLCDSRPTEMKYIWRPTVLASKYTSCKSSTVRWHFRPTEMEYIWSPTVLASKYTSCKSSTVRWQSPNGNEVYITPKSPG